MMPLVAQSLGKSFRDGVRNVDVLRDVSIAVAGGEVVAVEGPSGSGKTTLLSILGCILTPSCGKVVVDGEEAEPARLAGIRRRSLGFVFQQFHLFGALTAAENVTYALEVKGIRGRAAHDEAASVLDRVGLADRATFRPRDLSGGQKQRVAIARALAGRPRVLLADEPTANLDGESSAVILRLFRELARERDCALVIVTHDPRVRSISDRVLTMRDGRISPAH